MMVSRLSGSEVEPLGLNFKRKTSCAGEKDEVEKMNETQEGRERESERECERKYR